MTIKWKDLPFDGPEYDEAQDTLTRQSDINQMLLCAGRKGYENTPGFLAMVSEPLAFGTCTHHLISEDIIHGETQEGLLLSMNDWVDEILVEQYDWSLERVPNPRDFFSEITVAYRSWKERVQPTLADSEMLAIEEEQRMFLGEGNKGNIFLKGTADLVLDDTLVDWKTSGRPWKQSKADFSIQASLYMPLHKQTLNVSLQKFTFWVFDRSSGSWSALKTRRTVAQINSALVTALEFGRQQEAGVFPCTPVPEAAFDKKRGWYCKPKFCGAWNICDAKHINDGFNEKEKAVRSW